MGVRKLPNAYSIICDQCGDGFDTMGEAATIADLLKKYGRDREG